MSSRANRWRAPVTGAVAGLLVAAAVVGPSALASGGDATTTQAAAKAAKAAKAADAGNAAKPSTVPAAGCPGSVAGAEVKQPNGHSAGPGPAPFLAAVAQLVQAGTINAAQARVLDDGIRSGSIDTDQLVARGTLSSAQMQAVNDRLVAVKRSLAPQPSP